MFAMYDDDGLNFRNTIDHLYDVHSLSLTHRIHNDTKEQNQNNKKFAETLYKGKINEEAKNKYKQVANLDTRTEIFHVEQVMSHKSVIVKDSQTIQECFNLMEENKIQQLLIKTELNDANNLKGMITKNDILKHIMENPSSNIFNNRIYDISTKNIITTDPISDIRRVSKVMIDFNLNAIPVVNANDEVLGVVSRHDIVNAVSSIPHMQIWA